MDLNEYKSLQIEIEYLTEEIEDLYDRAYPSQKLSGMPSSHKISDSVGDLAANIADLISLLKSRKEECERKRLEIEQFIGSVADSEMRMILTYRHIK